MLVVSQIESPSKIIDSITGKPFIKLYKIYNLQTKDTTFVDTSLTIKKEYAYNLLRKDIFGLLPFANEGHVYNSLSLNFFSLRNEPEFGFKAKHINYLEIDDINYYNVPTPLTELYFKTVMEQGQSVDAFLTINTSPNLNFSIAYKGLRSNGKYINSITSSGNFRFTTSYYTPNKRYFLNAHFTGQDISNQENGGINDTSLFENSVAPYNQRERIETYFNDATSLLKGNRFFIDHSFIPFKNFKDISIHHTFSQEYKFYEFYQINKNNRFGNSFSNGILDKTRHANLYNKVAVAYKSILGNFSFGYANKQVKNYYKSVVYDSFGDIEVPSELNLSINSLHFGYEKKVGNVSFSGQASQNFGALSGNSLEAKATYSFNDDLSFYVEGNYQNKIPNLNYQLFQSKYVNYNWLNNFQNEKNTSLFFGVDSKWGNLEASISKKDNYLYFANTTNDINLLLIKPFQYNKSITVSSVEVNKEFKVGKFALDNTFLYQNVTNGKFVLNAPQFVTRNSLYFSDKIFKRAMFIQTGFIFNYFTEYNANDYNPLLGEFFVQNETKIGNFPTVDFFVNARVKQIRIFLKAEHLNSSFTGYNYYSAPNYPYRDFMVRFGVVWNFFK